MGPERAPDPHLCPAGPPFPSLSHQHPGRGARGPRRWETGGRRLRAGGRLSPPRPHFQAASRPGCDRQRPPCPTLRRLPVVYGPATPLQESCHHQLSQQELGSPICFEDGSVQADQRSSPEAAVSSWGP